MRLIEAKLDEPPGITHRVHPERPVGDCDEGKYPRKSGAKRPGQFGPAQHGEFRTADYDGNIRESIESPDP